MLKPHLKFPHTVSLSLSPSLLGGDGPTTMTVFIVLGANLDFYEFFVRR